MRQRLERRCFAADHVLYELVVGIQFDLAVEDVERIIIAVTLAENVIFLPNVEGFRRGDDLFALLRSRPSRAVSGSGSSILSDLRFIPAIPPKFPSGVQIRYQLTL